MKAHFLQVVISFLIALNCCLCATVATVIYVDNGITMTKTKIKYDYSFTSLDDAFSKALEGAGTTAEYDIYIQPTGTAYKISKGYNLTSITLVLQTADTSYSQNSYVTAVSSCAKIPYIGVNNASIIAPSISLLGVGLVTGSSLTNSLFLAPTTASISDVCFQIDTITQPLTTTSQTVRIELDDAPSSDWTNYLLSINGTDASPGDLTMQNIYVIGTIRSPFLLWSQYMNTLTMTNFNAYSMPRMMLATNKTVVSKFTIDGSSGSQLTTISDSTLNPCLTKISYYASMSMQNVVAQNLATNNNRYFMCIYQVSPPDDIVLSPSLQTFLLDTLTFSNNTFNNITSAWSFFYLKYSSGPEISNRTTTLQNLNLVNSVAITNTSDYSPLNVYLFGMDLGGNLTIKDGVFNNVTDFKLIQSVMNDAISSNLAAFQNFTFTNCYWLLGDMPVLDITVSPLTVDSVSPAPLLTKVSDISLTSNSFYREFLYYDNQRPHKETKSGYTNPRAWMTNVKVTDNECVYMTMFTFQKLNLDANNSVFSRNTMYSSKMIKSASGPSPLQLNNITADSNILLSSSSLVLKQFDTSKVTGGVDANSGNSYMMPYSMMVTNFYLTNTSFDEESRGFNIKGAPILIIANCTFKDLTFNSSSTLMTVADMLSSVSNAIINSTLALRSGYQSYLRLIGNVNLTNAFNESLPMLNSSNFALGYAMGSMTNSLVFVYRVYGSQFQNLTFNQSFLFDMSTVPLNQSLVSIDNNKFTSINVTNYQDCLVSSTSVQALNFGYNTLTSVSGIGVILSGTQIPFLTLSNNVVTQNNGTSFLRLETDESYNILAEGNDMQEIYSVATFFRMEIGVNYGSIIFKANLFNNIFIDADPSAYRQLNFLSVDTESAQSSEGSTPGLYIQNCNFTNVILQKDHRLMKQYQNGFLVASLSQDLFTVENCVFNNISIRYDNNLLFLVADTFKMINTTISNIENFEKFGSVYALSNNFYINNSQFINNTALSGKGGVIYFDFDAMQSGTATIKIENSIFTNNIAAEGSAFYVDKTQVNFTSYNNTFVNCSVSPNLKGSLFTFSGTTFTSFIVEKNALVYNQGSQQLLTVFNFDSVKTAQGATISVTNLNFTINTNLVGTLLGVQGTSASVLFYNVSVYDIRAITSSNVGAFSIMDVSSGTITVQQMAISGLTTDSSSLFYISCSKQFDSTMNVKDSKFENIIISQTNKSSTSSANFGIFHLSNKGNRATCHDSLSLTNVTFNQLNAGISQDSLNSSAVLADYSGVYTLYVQNSVFSNLVASKGPAISLQDTSDSVCQVSINNNQFVNTTSLVDGGAIYNVNNDVQLTGNTFTNSAALTGNGGAIYSGIALSFTSILSLNTFSNCTRYGNLSFKGSQPLGTAPTVVNLTMSTPSYLVSGSLSNGSLVLTNFSSYDFAKINITGILIDALDQIVYDTVYSDASPRTLSISISDQSADSRDCDYLQCQLTGPSLPLKVAASQYVPAVVSYKSSTYQVSSATFFVVLRHCINGEINTTLVNSANPPQCTPCATDYYSLNTLTDLSCTVCPEHATCLGGNSLVLDAGYWRASTMTDSIVACRTASSCLGGFDSTCRTGFQGPLCDSCDTTMRYVKASDTCASCPTYGRSLIFSLIVIAGMFGYQIWYIKAVRESNSYFIAYYGEKTDHEHGLRVELKINQGMYIRLFTTYYQIYGIISTFDLNFSQLFGQSDSSSSGSTTISEVIYSSSCSLLDLGIDGSAHIYWKLVLSTLGPVIKVIILAIFRAFLWKFNINDKRKSILIVTAVCLFLLDQPTIVQDLFAYLSCVTIEGADASYLESDLGIQCYTNGYNAFRNYFVIPALVIYILIIPGIMTAILYLYYKRRDLNDVKLRMNLGALYNEYHPRAFFWGIYLMLTKVILMYLGSSFYSDVKTRALSVFVVLYIYYGLYLRWQPYDKKQLYAAERMTLITYLFTIFGSIYYKDNTLPVVQWITLFIMAVLNIYVIGMLLGETFKSYLIQVKVFVLPIIRKKISKEETITNLDVNFLEQDFVYESKDESLDQVEDRIFGKDEDKVEPQPKQIEKETELPVL